MDSVNKTTTLQLSVVVPADLPLPSPQGANFFHFTVVLGEVQLLVGSINLLRVHEAAQRGESVTVIPDISARYTLSQMGFANLQAQLTQILQIVGQGAGEKA